MAVEDYDGDAFCPRYHKTMGLIGRRWTGSILRALVHGVDRFAELRRTVPGISDRLLAQRLEELQREEIVERIVHDETPVRIEYRLTRKGHELEAAITALSRWSDAWVPEPEVKEGSS